jgi:HEAT repeat protein
MKTLPASCALLCLILPSCEDLEDGPGTPAAGEQGAGNQNAQAGGGLPAAPTELDYEFAEWHDDFPYALHVPPKKLGLWYDRNAQQALEKIVANVSGLCTKPAWMMSKEFFDRHLERSTDLLIETLDETQRRRHAYDHAENLLAVIARQKSPAFAKAIVRTASHSHPGIRRAAYQALINAGDEDAVMEIVKQFRQMNRIEQADWIKAAARHLSDKNLFPLFREMLTKQAFAGVQAGVFDAVMKLPPKRAAKLFDPIWLTMPNDLQLHIAGIMHAAGDERGTVRLRHALRLPVEIVKRKIVAVQGASRGDPTPMTDELLALTNEDYEGLTELIVTTLRKIPGQRVTDTLLTLTDSSRSYQVRQLALRFLLERGETSELDLLVETVRKEPEGAKFRNAVADLVGAQYGKGATALLERLKKGSKKTEIYYIRMIARINAKESFEALREVFMRPEYVFPWRERHSNVTFLGVQLANLNRCVDEMVECLAALPRADYRRRSALIHVLANLAGAKEEDKETGAKVYSTLRKLVFDPSEIPQVRMLALDYMRKDVRLADAMRLKAALPKEKKGIRQYFSDYLFEFF